jgi:hypothetical protein
MPRDLSSLEATLATLEESIHTSLKATQPEPPELLFHYTNSGGLLGILNSSRLWATNFRFLNDASEVAYGVGLFESVVKERLADTEKDVISEFLERTLRTANAFDGMFDFYIACFCERDDLLNQWRVYAGSGGGFAIGLKSNEIGRRWGDLDPIQDFVLRKVIYDEVEQKRLICEVIDSTVQALDEATEGATIEESNSLIARCCGFVRDNVADYLVSFKHPAFDVENEWRLCHIVSRSQEDHVLFRDGPYGLTPYVCLDPSPMAGVNHNRLPISRITHGPVSDPANACFALEKLLRAKRYPFVSVAGSKLPMRVGL